VRLPRGRRVRPLFEFEHEAFGGVVGAALRRRRPGRKIRVAFWRPTWSTSARTARGWITPTSGDAAGPLGSGIVESTVKQVGHSVKGSEKHWGMPGVETTLQIVTHLISTDGAWDRFWNRHPLSKTT
jgi:hypothetical protein